MEKELDEWSKLHKRYMGYFQTKDLANYLKVSPRTIQRWLKEKYGPNKEQLIQIRQYLELKNNEKFSF